jgi:hypothetical protein
MKTEVGYAAQDIVGTPVGVLFLKKSGIKRCRL